MSGRWWRCFRHWEQASSSLDSMCDPLPYVPTHLCARACRGHWCDLARYTMITASQSSIFAMDHVGTSVRNAGSLAFQQVGARPCNRQNNGHQSHPCDHRTTDAIRRKIRTIAVAFLQNTSILSNTVFRRKFSYATYVVHHLGGLCSGCHGPHPTRRACGSSTTLLCRDATVYRRPHC